VIAETGILTDSPAPLDLDRLGEDMLESFTDLVYGGRQHGDINIGLTFKARANPLRVTATIQNIAEFQTQVVSSLDVEAGTFAAHLEWELNDPRGQARYTIRSGDQVWTDVQIEFRACFLLAWPSRIVRSQARKTS
jgi:hypothetical protein